MTTGRHVTYWTSIADAAQRQPDRPLLADEHGRSLSARQLHVAACVTAAAFADAASLPEPLSRASCPPLSRPTTRTRGRLPPAAGELRLPRADVDELRPEPAPTNDTRWIYYSSGTPRLPKDSPYRRFPDRLFETFDPATTPVAIAAHRPTFLGTATPFFVAYLKAQQARAVADVAVIGIPDPRTGERVCAVVVPANAAVSLESRVQHCRSQGLSRYKHPERLVIVDTLPRNQFGKLIKKDLRQAFS